MELNVYIVPIGFVVLLALLVWIAVSYRRVKKENLLLQQIIQTKDTTIANFEASRVSVKEVIENFTMADKVIATLETGKSREEVAKIFGIDAARVETIVKIDKLKA